MRRFSECVFTYDSLIVLEVNCAVIHDINIQLTSRQEIDGSAHLDKQSEHTTWVLIYGLICAALKRVTFAFENNTATCFVHTLVSV